MTEKESTTLPEIIKTNLQHLKTNSSPESIHYELFWNFSVLALNA